ncbi:YjcQ family protein [Clostridium sp. 'White wine YQ']|uniref:YjcQ family protein n=1 Tax=Clostridium sp. 'White wine YQ' TaxID=3027474 RepID=UPI002366469B|nr:YjcQ family protein [Clostridium sp. 'White wine YQ']MDD7793681.1 YjcQ family protein [Clostridium sp. 'White wine YQ']
MTLMDKIKYSILKELECNEDRLIKGEQIFIPHHSKYSTDEYKLDWEAFGKIIKDLEDEGLINCVAAKKKGLTSVIKKISITSKGKQYLKDNSALSRIYKGIKEIKEFIK